MVKEQLQRGSTLPLPTLLFTCMAQAYTSKSLNEEEFHHVYHSMVTKKLNGDGGVATAMMSPGVWPLNHLYTTNSTVISGLND
jgi:hypothetical protein